MESTRPVVTLWETYGSGMADVAARIAAALELEVMPQAFSSEDLERAREEMEPDSVLAWVAGLLRGDATRSVPTSARPAGWLERVKAENTADVRAAAANGGVIMGRNATVILADHPAVLHVKLDGARASRVANAAASFRLTPEHAAMRQQREDALRSRMSMELYGWDPRDNDHYDLVLNTALLGPQRASRIILAAAEMKFAPDSSEDRT